MKKRKSISSSTNKSLSSGSQKSIKNFFKPVDRPSFPFDFNDENFIFKEEASSDSDCEIIESTFSTSTGISSFTRTSSFSNFKRDHSEEDDEVILIETTKKFKVETATISHDPFDEDSNSLQRPSSTIRSEHVELENDNRHANNRLFEDEPVDCLDDPYTTPIKRRTNETYPLSSPSPYFKNLSDTLNNSQNFEDMNKYLSVQLKEIEKTKTPKSDKKIKNENDAPTVSSINTIKKELQFEQGSPIKSNHSTPIKVNLKDKKELKFSEVNRINFNKIIKTVLDDALYKCLFDNEDYDRISTYSSLNNDEQSLFIKLFFRKHTWIRRSSIKYDEFTGDLDELLSKLLNKGFLIDSNGLQTLEEGLHVLDGPEVKEFAKQSKVTITYNNKAKMIEAILNFVRTTNTLSFSTSKLTLEQRKLNELKRFLGDKCFKVNMDNSNIFLRMILLYFPPIFFEKPINTILSETL